MSDAGSEGLCPCGEDIASVSLSHYMQCGEDGLTAEEAELIEDAFNRFLDRAITEIEAES